MKSFAAAPPLPGLPADLFASLDDATAMKPRNRIAEIRIFLVIYRTRDLMPYTEYNNGLLIMMLRGMNDVETLAVSAFT